MLAIVALGTGLTFVMFGISSFLIFRSVRAEGASAWALGAPQPGRVWEGVEYRGLTFMFPLGS